jgi:hypothetical protein
MALKLADMKEQGDVIVVTHTCPNAPTTPHEPVPFMGSPVDMKRPSDSPLKWLSILELDNVGSMMKRNLKELWNSMVP